MTTAETWLHVAAIIRIEDSSNNRDVISQWLTGCGITNQPSDGKGKGPAVRWQYVRAGKTDGKCGSAIILYGDLPTDAAIKDIHQWWKKIRDDANRMGIRCRNAVLQYHSLPSGEQEVLSF